MKKILTLGILTISLLGTTASVQAINIYGLTSSNQLIRFDSATPGTVTTIGTISQSGIVDIDFYPVNNLLYAFTATGSGFSLNLTTAAATLLITPSPALTGITDVDFNNAADRIRLHGAGDANYRMQPDVASAPETVTTPGAVTFDPVISPAAVQIVGSAYTNAFDNPGTTTLYTIDTTSDSLEVHTTNPGSFQNATQVGAGLGVAVGSNVGFDIGQDGIAYLSDDNNLYTVNLTTGVATTAGTVAGSGLVSIAVETVPEPGSALLGLFGAASLIARRQRKA